MAEQQKKLRFHKQSTSAKPGTLAKAKNDVSFLTAKVRAAESQNMPGGYIGSLIAAKGNAQKARTKRSRSGDESTTNSTESRRAAVKKRYASNQTTTNTGA
jgi:hypothetical protein